jgi:small subunit ribosomal protein S7
MSRRSKTFKREIIPDAVYKDVTVAKFINKMMIQGKKAVAQKLFYAAMDELKGKIAGEEPISIFKKAIENCKPALEVRSRRVGGATYQVPTDVRPSRRLALAMRWMIEYSRERGEKDYAKRLSAELVEAFNNRGNAIKKREEVHKMAEANKAFSHYNW